MAELISPGSQEPSLSSQQQQQQLCRQTEGPMIQAPSTPSSTQPNRTSARPVAPSLKYPQQLNQSIRAEADLVSPIPASFSSSSYSSPLSTSFPSSSTSSPSPLSPTGPAIGGRVSAAITSLYQASAAASDSSSVPRINSNTHLARLGGGKGGQSSRLHFPSVFTSNHLIQGSRADQGFAEDTLSSLSNLISQPPPQHQQCQQQKQTTPLVETTLSNPTPTPPPQSMTLATAAPLDSAAPSSLLPCSSTSLSSPFVALPPTSTLSSSNSPVPVPTSTTLFMSITPENKVSFAPVVSTITREEEMQQKEQQQKQMQDKQQLDDKKKEEKEEEVKKVVVVEENGDIKGENESKEFNNNTTTTMSTTNTTKAKSTTTIISSCDSTSTSASMPTATAIPATTNAGHQVHTACVIPPVGRDNLRYGSLDAAAMSDEGTLLSMALIDTTTKKLRPMSSMEYAESWLLTTAPSDNDSPMTGNAASSRRPSADTTGLELTHLSAYHHTLFRPLTMVTDQVTASGAVALTNGPRLSTDQESVHPFQLDPEPRLSFDNNNNNARRTSLSSSSSLPPPFSSTSNPSSTGESWLSLAPPSSSSTVSSSDFAQSAPAPLSIQTQVGAVPHKTIRKKASLASKIRKVFIKQTMSGSSNGNNTGSSNGSSSNGSFSSKDQDVDILHHHHHHHHHHCSTQTLEDITSTSMSSSSSRDGEIDVQGGLLRNGRGGAGIGVGVGAAGELCPPPASHLIEHRGSVSSSSSGESVSVGQGGDLRPCTPSTSPEMSPSGSPKPKHATSPLIIGPSTAIADGVPYGHPLSPVEINRLAVSLAPIGPSKPTEKRMNLEQTSSRTSKKRLSFASITSFFNARNADAMAVSKKTKQQRSSSVPNVESPLTDAGRQQQGSIAFQRRHSLNDLETGPQLQAKFAAPPWDKDRVSAQAAAAAAESLIKATERETSSGAKTMSKIQGVFGKQSKKNKGKKSTSHSENAPTTTTIVSSAKPLRLALAHRPVTAPSVRKVQVVHRHQGSISKSGRRLQHHQNEPLVNLSQEPVVNNNNSSGSRRNSEEHSHTGPTRHRRQSSIAGRQASQQGHYPQVDRKQRLSVRYSSSEEYDIVHHPDLYTLDQHQQQQQQQQQHQQQQQQQQQQFQYHGGYVQYDGSTVPQTPRINPLSTKPMTPQANDPPNYPLVNISPCTSRGAVAEGSLTFSPTGSRRRDSYISCSSSSPSKDTSPKLPSASTPRQQQNYPGTAAAVAAAIGNPHRRSSYDATTNNRRSSYEANSRRNSIIVTSSISLSPPPKSAPVARLSVDHTLMSDHPGPSSPSAYPQAIAANGNHQHAIFANHQQQQQLQLQQQLHYQQFQRTQQQQHQQQHHHHHQMQYAPDHHHQHHHHYQQQQQQQQQQFMTPHAGSQVFHEQYHTHPQQPQQQQLYQYPPYPYQYNMQQPLPSHLCYTSVQHPALAYTGVSSTNSMQPPPPLQYSTSKSSGSGSGNGSGGNPSPTSWSSISPSHAPSTPPRSSRQFHFSTAPPMIHETWTPEQYDRTSDPNITAHRLTPAIAQRIKLELNQFKSQEMLVHQESRVNTHFFA